MSWVGKKIVPIILSLIIGISGITCLLGKTVASAAEENIVDINSGWTWPLAQNFRNITSGFGYRASMGDYHQGIDISSSGIEGQPIYAARKGTVVYVGVYYDCGNMVSIRHGTYNGATIYTTYMHMKYQACVSVGQEVDQSTVIGYVGGTGTNGSVQYGVHLHFQICKNDKNPAHGNNSQLNANYYNPASISYSYDHTPPPTDTTPPTNAWIKSDKSVIKVGEIVTFTYDAEGAYRYRVGAARNGTLTVFEPGTSKSCSASFSESGWYAVHSQCFNDYGYVDSPEIYIYVYDSTPTNAWATASATTVQVGEPVTFTYGAQGAYSQAFNYYINGSLTTIFIGFGTQQYTYSFDSPGTYITHITNYNDYGLTDSQDIVIHVYDSTPINVGEDFYAYIILLKNWKQLENSGGNVQIAVKGNNYSDPKQIWHFEHQNDNSYKIINEFDGSCLHLPGGTTTNGNNVCTYTDNGTAAQRWYVISNSWCSIMSVLGDSVLDSADGSAAAGNNIQIKQLDPAGSEAQIFSIWNVENDGMHYIKPNKPSESNIFSVSQHGSAVTFNWNESPLMSEHYDSRCYDIRIWQGTDLSGSCYKGKYGISDTSCLVDLPAGTYTANIAAVNTKYYEWYTFGSTYTFTVYPSECSVKFDPNGGSDAPANQTKKYGEALTLSTEIPARNGYTFTGWNTKADGTGTNYTPGASYTTEADATLYAQWIANTPVVNPAAGSGAVVDESTRFIYGLSVGSAQDCVSVTDGTAVYEYQTAKQVIGTGTKVNIYNNDNELADSYTIIIFGDINGDGWYNGTDAYFVSLIANGLLPTSSLTDAQLMAADCNHDGAIDEADVSLLEQAGLLLAEVDQTLPSEELQTNSVYPEYCSLINQSIEINELDRSTSTDTHTEEPAQTVSGVWQIILDLFKRLVAIVTMIF